MSTETFRNHSFVLLKEGLLNQLQDKSYGAYTISNYRRKLNQLERYMTGNGIDKYEPSVGQQFIDDYLMTHILSEGNQQFMRTVIRRLDDYSIGNYRLQCKAERIQLTQNHTESLEAYLQKCRADGNRESTISGKDSILREFLFSSLCPWMPGY